MKVKCGQACRIFEDNYLPECDVMRSDGSLHEF